MTEERVSPWLLEAYDDIAAAAPVCDSQAFNEYGVTVLAGARSLWCVVERSGVGLALRAAYDPAGELRIAAVTSGSELVVESTGSIGRFRTRLRVERNAPLNISTWLSPIRELAMPFWPRDVIAVNRDASNQRNISGEIYTSQRGLRSGTLFGSVTDNAFGSFLYLQNFTALNDYFETLRCSPADTVGGTWPELGYAAPGSSTHALAQDREIQISDVFLALDPAIPAEETGRAELYLDALAQIYLALPKPATTYHAWPDKARLTLQHLSNSPDCTYVVNGRRYLKPYVGDATKPPESMVQCTVLLPILEYERWAGVDARLADDLLDSIESFFDPKIGAIVRYVHGFDSPGPDDVKGNPRNIDSWYLYHSLFNLSRLIRMTDGSWKFRELFASSVEYAVKVAHRFDYQWPVFFDLDTLEVLRGETNPGKGGEQDVAGLYALVMIHAYELLGEKRFLDEAKRAAEHLRGRGFTLAYQMNVTGFAAEAMLRLYLYTDDRAYLDLSTLCLANVFDNMWLWDCNYGFARDYHTFFGMFPLPDAPYLAAYEELEAPAKFREYLRIAHEHVRPSVRLLLAEYNRYVLDRTWQYFPDALPAASLAQKSQNGHIDVNLAVPVEDLQDGWSQSGQVGQEVYGAGLALGLAARNYYHVEAFDVMLYCSYPTFRLCVNTRSQTLRATAFVAGDPRANAEFRAIVQDVSQRLIDARCRIRGGRAVERQMSAEGHVVFAVPGGSEIELELRFEDDR